MITSRYVMRDFNDDKIDAIMQFDVSAGRGRSRSVLEFGVFMLALLGYLGMLVLAA